MQNTKVLEPREKSSNYSCRFLAPTLVCMWTAPLISLLCERIWYLSALGQTNSAFNNACTCCAPRAGPLTCFVRAGTFTARCRRPWTHHFTASCTTQPSHKFKNDRDYNSSRPDSLLRTSLHINIFIVRWCNSILYYWQTSQLITLSDYLIVMRLTGCCSEFNTLS